jgi:hypothetical protein
MQPRLTTVEDLDEWLDGVAMAEQSIRAESHDHSQSNPKKNSKEKRQGSKSINVFATTAEITTEPSTAISPRCPGCNSTHKHHLKDCRQFKKIPVEKRVAIVKENKVCFRCLLVLDIVVVNVHVKNVVIKPTVMTHTPHCCMVLLECIQSRQSKRQLDSLERLKHKRSVAALY